ncbi:hypothetical protein T492DRAFT_908078 [Pavlovales sp. CCMP2436]|nr:hypothetical protein T492DRAFT_908078 [Pavlovales sp. CCMP2436]
MEGTSRCCGHLEALRYAHEHGWGSQTCKNAAHGGHLEVLRYAHENGFQWGIDTCWRAAEGGHLEVMRYAHEHGCEWHRFTCSDAAQGGHLEVLRYAHEHGCPIDLECHAAAEQNGHVAVLEYLLAAQPAAELRLDWKKVTPQLQPAGSEMYLDWDDRQYAGLKKFLHARAVACLSKRQRIDIDQTKRIVDARPRCPCCEQTIKENKHGDMRVSARHIMNRHAGALRLTTSTKFKLHLNKATRIFEIQRK